MKNYTPPPTTELTVTRLIPARAEEVYDVWLDPKKPGGVWYGAKRVILDCKVDGLFYHAGDFEGREWAHYGRFTTLDRPRRIVHTWVSEGTRGLESVVSITLAPEGKHTRVTLRHSGVPNDPFGRQHEEGWTYVLGALEKIFSSAPAR